MTTDGAHVSPPIRRGLKTSELVAREILRDITARRLEHGARLPAEAVMLRQYGVSRGSLREALRILEVNGVIAIKAGPRGGPVVIRGDASDFGKMATLYFQVSRVTFAQLAEARVLLEPMMARLAAKHRTDRDVRRLNALLAGPGKDEQKDQADYVDMSLNFHDMVAEMSRNPVLALIASSFREIFTMYRTTELTTSENAAIMKVHGKIAAAIIDRDADAAESHMRRHMTLFAKDFRRRHPSLVDEVVHWV